MNSSQPSEEVKDKIVKLIKEHQILQRKYEQMVSENKLLHKKSDDMQLEIADLKAKYERLKLAKAFGLSEESKKQAHRKITKLVRDIDSCIAILKK